MNETKNLRNYIKISKKAIAKNYTIFRSLIGKDCQLMAIVKSNAYGHSLIDFSQEMEKLGADWLGVDSVVEGLALRQAGIKKPILVLGYTLFDRIIEATQNNISLTVSNFNSLNCLQKLFQLKNPPKKPVKIHLKIDTGMHRQGFFVSDLKRVVSFLKKHSDKIKLEGVYTHFADAKNPAFPQETKKQLLKFKEAVKILKSVGFNPIRHTAATSATIIFPETHLDMARIGIGLYGMWPAKEVQSAFEKKIKLTPVLKWKTIIAEIKTLSAGDRIGYNFTEAVNRKSKVAILPIGYWHGYPRALSGVGKVFIRGKEAKVLGRISMDMTVVDITDIKKARVKDKVVLIGKNFTADNIASLSDTTNYEITTRINPLIKRIYK